MSIIFGNETRILILLITALHAQFVECLLCYRCDSQVNEDCRYYPAPMSTYEDCSERPILAHREHNEPLRSDSDTQNIVSTNAEQATETLYIRYRYKICPLMEKTTKHVTPMTPSPLESSNFVCGKAVSRNSHNGKLRVRRGCTPDLFLNGYDACVSVSPQGLNEVACFCSSDLCNDGSSIYHIKKGMIFISLILSFTFFGTH